jgi:hypothetical protein
MLLQNSKRRCSVLDNVAEDPKCTVYNMSAWNNLRREFTVVQRGQTFYQCPQTVSFHGTAQQHIDPAV